MEFVYPDGATPLDPDAARGLIPDLRTQSELNAFEGRNIADGLEWARRSRKLRSDLVSVDGLCLLHKRMFDQTWTWAGEFRRVNTNIGVDWPRIGVQLRELCDDVPYWIENETYPWTELGVRFHHRLVQIHPWWNGNGRHGRIAANLLLEFHKQPPIHWVTGMSLTEVGAARGVYIAGMRAADAFDYGPLLRIAAGHRALSDGGAE